MTRMICVFLALILGFFSMSLQAEDKKDVGQHQHLKTQYNNDESDVANRLLVIIKRRNQSMGLR